MTQPLKALYLLRPPAGQPGPSVVVRAACAQCARTAAAAQAGEEGTAYWRDPDRTSCVGVKLTGISGTVLRRDG